jgi:glycosyltransferase involved in cell wall biosynthesis
MITLNEERFIKLCLDSVKDYVDEIMVVDNGSTDRTVEILESYGAKVFIDKTRGDLSYLRNLAKSKSNGEWIFFLDGDECVEKEDMLRIVDLCNSKLYYAFSFSTRIFTNIFDVFHKYHSCKGERQFIEKIANTKGYVDIKWAMRLFKNDSRFIFEGYIHEMINPSIERCNAKFTDIDINFNHLKELVYNDSPEDCKYKRFELEKKNALLDSFKESVSHNYRMGRDLILLEKNNEKAIIYLNKAITLAPSLSHYFYFIIGWGFYKENNIGKALYYFRKSFQSKSNYAGAIFMIGVITKDMNFLNFATMLNPDNKTFRDYSNGIESDIEIIDMGLS